MPTRRATVEQLRQDIDRGRTGAKVNFPDPAAAPLDTDSEAAGTPPNAYEIENARSIELRGPDVSQRATSGPALYVCIIVAIAFVLGLGILSK